MFKIAIHSVPRSGSTWLGEIFNSSRQTKYCFQPLFSYRFKSYLSSQSTVEDLLEFFTQLAKTTDAFIDQQQQRVDGTLPSSTTTELSHVVYKEVRYHNILENMCSLQCGIKFVFLIRNPIDVINSWFNSPKEFDPSWNLNEELLHAKKKNKERPEEFYGLQAWIDTTILFQNLSQRYPEDVILVSYADLQKNTLQTVEQLFSFCKLPYDISTKDFIRKSQTTVVNGTYSVFRGGKETRRTLPERQVERIERLVVQNGLEKYMM